MFYNEHNRGVMTVSLSIMYFEWGWRVEVPILHKYVKECMGLQNIFIFIHG